MIEAGKKAAETRRSATYSVEQHIADKDPAIAILVNTLREFCLSLAETVEESPKKFYVAYKLA